MNLDFSPEDNAFRAEARAFLAENYPKALRDKQERGETLGKEDYLSWHRILAKKGWSAPSSSALSPISGSNAVGTSASSASKSSSPRPSIWPSMHCAPGFHWRRR